MTGKIIAIVNQKGGVGKTTTSVNLSASLASLKKNILLVDLDPQGNTTTGSGIEKESLVTSVNEVLLQEADVDQCVMSTPAGYDLLPANRDLTSAEVALLQHINLREHRLSQALGSLRENYDFIFVDCPPSLSMLTVNALVAADTVLIPMQCEYYALEGLSGLLETINKITKTISPQLKVEGVLRTMYDGRNSLTTQVSEQLIKYFDDRVYKTTIPRNVRLAEAPSFGLPALLYDKRSPGAAAYLELAHEVIQMNTEDPPPVALNKRSEVLETA